MRRTTSERSFVLETNRDTVEMAKHSRKVRSRCEFKMTKQRYEETERDHDFLVIKNRTVTAHKANEQKYQKAFLKNGPMPKYNYPHLGDMLAIASKTLYATGGKGVDDY